MGFLLYERFLLYGAKSSFALCNLVPSNWLIGYQPAATAFSIMKESCLFSYRKTMLLLTCH